MMDRWLDMLDEVVEGAWYRLVWMFRVCVILGVLAGVAYAGVSGLSFPDWVRVEIVVGAGPKESLESGARAIEGGAGG
ncbi:MAG: hypothetical protein OXP66_05335 [Candidatus Tectomicrobia bacterium]|nr:hypothetical protein [Candidatus Tectomicrobia bacterium]